ncbi:BglG family transcription antiterminator [Sporolactobacillus nakayamae]|uniref:Ascorbate-specific PTS system EIIA component n=1 Tax=Sporolactobacillus nakayamae TaxID=269670 RepID=A0A1I2QVS4_9BACL|nr:PRD domain-containing protein [Sporolactobacillus nakayamae]SFG32474.1 Transcriptional antiterminator [Sporolactobacillus nakayamae]
MIILDREITNLILVQKHLSVEEIANHLSTEKDRVLERIHLISEQLPHESIEVVNGEVKVSEKCVDELYASLVGNLSSNSNEYEVDLRKNLIKLELIVRNNHHTLQTLSDLFYVSKNTVFSDMKYLKEELKNLNLHVTYLRKDGYQINGPEYLIRNHLVQLINELLKTAYGRSCLIDRFDINKEMVSRIKQKLESIEEEIMIRLTDEQIENLPIILSILLQRVQNFPRAWSFKVERYDIRNTLEFPVIKKQFREFPFLKDVDLLYLSLHILSSNRIESALDFADSEEISSSVNQFITLLKEKLAIDFVKETDFKSKIMLHIQPAIFRNILGFRVNNPLTERFIKEHYYVFKAVTHASRKSFGTILEHDFSDEEIVYLSMIVLGWMYQTDEDSSAYYKAVVLCFNGTSVSKLLLENLKDMFPDIEFIGAFSFRQFEQMNLEPDFIFTTVPMKSRITTIIVPPFLEPDSRKQLRKVVSKLLSQDPKRKAKGIVFAIKDLIPEDKRELAELALKSFFDKEEEKRPIYRERISLTEENISVIDSPVSWENCVDIAFKPIINRKSIENDYIDKCKSIFYSNYRQMLIGPEVYLPHAAVSKESADIQITIFKRAVTNPDGHSFKIMVALVPEKTNAHVPLLLKLNDVFLERGRIEAIIACKSRKDILNLLEGG